MCAYYFTQGLQVSPMHGISLDQNYTNIAALSINMEISHKVCSVIYNILLDDFLNYENNFQINSVSFGMSTYPMGKWRQQLKKHRKGKGILCKTHN